MTSFGNTHWIPNDQSTKFHNSNMAVQCNNRWTTIPLLFLFFLDKLDDPQSLHYINNKRSLSAVLTPHQQPCKDWIRLAMPTSKYMYCINLSHPTVVLFQKPHPWLPQTGFELQPTYSTTSLHKLVSSTPRAPQPLLQQSLVKSCKLPNNQPSLSNRSTHCIPSYHMMF